MAALSELLRVECWADLEVVLKAVSMDYDRAALTVASLVKMVSMMAGTKVV
jgi:hypothetical protein